MAAKGAAPPKSRLGIYSVRRAIFPRQVAVSFHLGIGQPSHSGREGHVLSKPRDAQRHRSHAGKAAMLNTGRVQIDVRKRKWIAEPPKDWIKNALGFRPFSLRGLKKPLARFSSVA